MIFWEKIVKTRRYRLDLGQTLVGTKTHNGALAELLLDLPDGEIQGLFDMAAKGLSALFIGGSGWFLDIAGYQPNQPQEPRARLAIQASYALIPSCFGFLSVLILSQYGLTKAMHHEARLRALKGDAEQQQQQQG